MGFLPVAVAQLALTADPWDDNPTWTTLKGLLGAHTEGGRDVALQAFSARRGDAHFNNRDRSYDPLYTGGPYGANLVPDKQFRIMGGLNLLTENQSSLELAALVAADWVAASNCSVARANIGSDGSWSLQLTSSASGDMSAVTPDAAIPIFGGQTYTALCRAVRGQSVARGALVQIAWWTAAGTFISLSTGSTVTEPSPGTFGGPLSCVGVAPANAAWASIGVKVLATGAAGEVHLFDKLGFFAGTDPALPWSRGSWAPLFTGTVESWAADRASQTASETTCVAYDIFKLLSYRRLRDTAFYDAVLALGPLLYWRLAEKPVMGASVPMYEEVSATTYGSLDGGWKSTEGPLVTDPSPAADFGDAAGRAFVTGFVPANTGTPNGWSLAFWFRTSTAGDHDTTTPAVEYNPAFFSQFYADGTNAFAIQLALHSNGTGTGIKVVVTDDVGGQTWAGPSDPAYPVNDGKWHFCVFTRNAAATQYRIYIDGQQAWFSTTTAVYNTSSGTANMYFCWTDPNAGHLAKSAQAAMKDVAFFAFPLTGAQVLSLYNKAIFPSESVGARLGRISDIVGLPTSRRHFDTGITLQPYTKPLHGTPALAPMQQAVEADGGSLFCDAANAVNFFSRTHSAPAVAATIADNPSGHEIPVSPGPGPLSDDSDVYDEVSITGDSITPVLVNSGSPGNRVLSISDWQGANQSDAATIATALYNRYSTPVARVHGLAYEPQSEAQEGANVATKVDLLSRITHRDKGVGSVGSPVSTTQYVEKVTHDIAPLKLWSVAYSISPY